MLDSTSIIPTKEANNPLPGYAHSCSSASKKLIGLEVVACWFVSWNMTSDASLPEDQLLHKSDLTIIHSI